MGSDRTAFQRHAQEKAGRYLCRDGGWQVVGDGDGRYAREIDLLAQQDPGDSGADVAHVRGASRQQLVGQGGERRAGGVRRSPHGRHGSSPASTRATASSSSSGSVAIIAWASKMPASSGRPRSRTRSARASS